MFHNFVLSYFADSWDNLNNLLSRFLKTYDSHIIHIVEQCNIDKLNWGQIDIT